MRFSLVCKEEIVILPETTLDMGAEGRFRQQTGACGGAVGRDIRITSRIIRELLKHQSELTFVFLHEASQDMGGMLAVGTIKIAEINKDQGSLLRPAGRSLFRIHLQTRECLELLDKLPGLVGIHG